MKRLIPILLVTLAVLGARAVAQPTPVPGLQRVNHDSSMTGSGTIPGPLGVRVVAGGGITTLGGTAGVGLVGCTAGQVLQSTGGTSYACADNSSQVAGTVNTIPYYTLDGAHLGSTAITYDSIGGEMDAPIARVKLGQGDPAGAPLITPTAAVCVNDPTQQPPLVCPVGVLTGVYKWAYNESDGVGGTTGLSPVSSPLTLAAQSADVTVGLVRKGMAERHLCRTKAGGSTYYDVHNFGGGVQFFSTHWVDNIPDSSLVTLCPTVDTTKIYTWDISSGVKFIRTPPSVGIVPSDLTLVTGDPSTAGVYALDAYNTVVARSFRGPSFEAIKSGLENSDIADFYWSPDRDSSATYNASAVLNLVFAVGNQGGTLIHPYAIQDAGSTLNTHALTVSGLLPAIATVDHSGVSIDITGNGSSAHESTAASIILEPGYGGVSNTQALAVFNGSVSSGGISSGAKISNSAASFQGVGVQGYSFAATHNVGLFGGVAAMPSGHDAIIYADNGSTSTDLFLGTNSTSGTVIRFEVTNAGGIYGGSAGAYLTPDGALGFQAGTNATATGYINYYGYSPANVPGLTQFRNLILADGKGATVCTLTGSTKTLNCTGLQVGGVAVSTTTGTVTNIATSAGITGGPITNTGTIGYDNTVIQSRVSGTCTGPNAITSIAVGGTVTCSTGVLSTSNLAGTNNRLVKITSANTGGDSSITDDGTTVSTAESTSIGSATGKGRLAVVTIDEGSGVGDLVSSTGWNTAKWLTVGPNVTSATGSGLGFAYSTTDDTAIIASIAPNVAWKPLKIMAGSYSWWVNNTSKMTFDGTTLAITGGLTTSTTVVATGNINGANVSATSGGWLYWGDGTTRIIGANSSSMSLITSATTRIGIAAAGLVTIGLNASPDAPGAANTALIVEQAGTTCSEVRDATNDVEAEHCASSSGAFFGSQSNHSAFFQTNNTNAIKVDTSQLVTVLKTLTVGPGSDTVAAAGSAGSWQNNGATSMSVRDASDDSEIALIANNLGVQVGSTTNHGVKVVSNGTTAISIDTAQNSTFAGHIIGGSGTPSVSAGGGCGTSPSIVGNDNFGKITVGSSTSTCVLTFAIAYASHEPACHATSTSANSNISISAAAAGSVTFSQTSPSMSGTSFYYVCGGY